MVSWFCPRGARRALAALSFAAVLPGACTDTVRTTPVAILDDGTDSAVLEVIPGAPAAAVVLHLEGGVPLIVDGISACDGPRSIPLNDDGVRGDRAARDGVFSLGGIRWHANAPASCNHGIATRPTPALRSVIPGGISIVRGTGSSYIPQWELWVLAAAEFGLPEPVAQLGPGLQVTAHAVNIVDNQSSINRMLNGEALFSLAPFIARLYSALPDVYDFINLTTADQRGCDGNRTRGLHVMAKQTWTGTGVLPFDASAAYGSAGKLLGINLIERQSSDDFRTFLHETMHQWAAYLPPALGLSATGGHWHENANVGGAAGGGVWRDNGDGTYQAVQPEQLAGWRIPPLELYLMGLAHASEVPPVLIAEMPPGVNRPYGARLAGPFRQVTIGQIQQTAGPRTPGPEGAQRHFRAAFLVTSTDRLLTAREMTAFDRISRVFSGALPPRPGAPPLTFEAASGGRAAVETATLPCAFTLNPPTLAAAPAGRWGSIQVAASASHCRWTASGSAGWISIVGAASGSGSGVLTYHIAPNEGIAARTGSIIVTGATVSQAASVFEAGRGSPMADDSGGTPAFAAEMDLVCGAGLFAGCPHAESPLTRGDAAAAVVRGLTGGGQFSFSPAPYFDDVPPGHSHFPWVQKLRELGITAGCGERRFCPKDVITRGQLAAFLVRARLGIRHGQGFPFPSRRYFADVPPAHPRFPEIQKLREWGATTGCSAVRFCPESPSTHGQAAAFLARSLLAR